MGNKLKSKLAGLSVIGVYLLIAFEFFYMASPFAIYFYAIYKPGLSFLNRIPSISWLTGFFMPHLVEDTKSSILSSIPSIGAVFAVLGFLFFVICAIQIYYSKLTNKKAVTKGIYKYVRHPQYTAFAICSLGLLLLWPRYLTLLFYIVLLFAYYWLASIEEKECVRKFGEDYTIYKDQTSMFFPLPKWLRIPIMLLSNVSGIKRIGFFILILIMALSFANVIKIVSIKQIYSYSSSIGNWISIFKTEDSDFKNISQIIQNNSEINKLIMKKAGCKNELINYLLPQEMYISEIPMVKPEIDKCHVRSLNYNQKKIKIIITLGIHNERGQIFIGNKLLQKTLSLKPIVEVWVDTDSRLITRIIDLPESERYTNIPEPIF